MLKLMDKKIFTFYTQNFVYLDLCMYHRSKHSEKNYSFHNDDRFAYDKDLSMSLAQVSSWYYFPVKVLENSSQLKKKSILFSSLMEMLPKCC